MIKKLALVTYQSFEKFINVCINKNITIDNLVFVEAQHIVGDKIQDILLFLLYQKIHVFLVN